MPAFDLGLVNGDPWGGTQLDSVENGITDRGIETATTAQRNAIAGARLFHGKTVFDTTLGDYVWYSTVDSTWHGMRPHWYLAAGLATSSASNSPVTLYTGTLPTYGVAGVWLARYMVFFGRTGGTTVTGRTVVTVSLGGNDAAALFPTYTIDAASGYTAVVTGSAAVAAGGSTVSVAITRITASPADVTITTVADVRYHRFDAEWIPA